MTVVVCWSVISLYRHETCANRYTAPIPTEGLRKRIFDWTIFQRRLDRKAASA